MEDEGVRNGFIDTNELLIIRYDDDMTSKEKWLKFIEEEHQNLKDYIVFQPVEWHKIPRGS
jgi:hypothetical protein